MEKSDKKVIMMFGLLGAGKSTVANAILGKEVFKSGDTARSVTRAVTSQDSDRFVVMDVPGMGDPEITTKDWIQTAATMANKKIDLILFTVNSTNRVSNNEVIYSIALKHLVKNLDTRKVAFCFTRCGTENFTKEKGTQYIDQLWKCLKWTNEFKKVEKTYMFEKTTLNAQEFRSFIYNCACDGQSVQVKNLVTEITSIKKQFVKEATETNEEAGEMAEDLADGTSCFWRRSIVQRRNKDGTIGHCELQDLQLDDQVLSFDYTNKQFFYDKIVYIHDHSKDHGKSVPKYAGFQKLVIQNQQNQISRTIKITGNHYVFTKKPDHNQYQQICTSEAQVGDQFVIIQQDKLQSIQGTLVSKEKEILKNGEAILVQTKNSLIVVDGTVQSCLTLEWDNFFRQQIFPVLANYLPSLTKKFLVQGSESIRYNSDSRGRKLFKLLGYSGL